MKFDLYRIPLEQVQALQNELKDTDHTVVRRSDWGASMTLAGLVGLTVGATVTAAVITTRGERVLVNPH